MNYLRCIKSVLIIVVVVSFVGCKAKQEKTDAANKGKVAIPAAVPLDSPGAPAVPPQDVADARTAAVKVLAQFEAGDFPAIYKNAASGFKKLGSESQFVGKFQQTRQKVGVLKNPREISTAVRKDNSIVLVYRVENEHFQSDMRMTFARSADKKMELAGVNQHDEPKK